MNDAYKEELQTLLFEATGTRNVLDLPLDRFENKSKIVFDRVRGSVRLMAGMLATESDAESYINKVLNTRLP